MEKNQNYLIIKKLCEMPSCTFKVNTPDGELRITVIQKGTTKEDPKEYDMRSEVTIIKEDNSVFSSIYYRDWDSYCDNRGGTLCNQTVNYGADDIHPEGYTLTIIYKDNYFNNISYWNNGIQYVVFRNSVSIDNSTYNVSGGEIFKQFEDEPGHTIGVNPETGEKTVYIRVNTGTKLESSARIPFSGATNFIDIMNRFNMLYGSAINGVASQLKSEYQGETLEQLLNLLPYSKPINISDEDKFRAREELTKSAANIYKNNLPLLDHYYNPKTMLAIEKASDKYMVEQGASIDRGIGRQKQLRRGTENPNRG